MNKISINITIILITILCSKIAFSKETDIFSLHIDKNHISCNEEIKIELNLNENTDCCGIQGVLFYDGDIFELLSVEKGKVLSDSMANTVNSDIKGKVKLMLLCDGAVKDGGNIISVCLRAKKASVESEISFDNIIIVDSDKNSLEYEKISEKISIESNSEIIEEPVSENTVSKEKTNTVVNIKTASPKKEETISCKFEDIKNHWGRENIEYLYNKGIINGVTQGYFEPDRNITRAEFVTVVSKLLNLTSLSQNTFNDVKTGSWYEKYVCMTSFAGIVKGSDNLFRPQDYLTRAELAVIAQRILELKNKADEKGEKITFDDSDDIPSWALKSVETVTKAKIMVGDDRNLFFPSSYTTRAETAAVIKRIDDIIH